MRLRDRPRVPRVDYRADKVISILWTKKYPVETLFPNIRYLGLQVAHTLGHRAIFQVGGLHITGWQPGASSWAARAPISAAVSR